MGETAFSVVAGGFAGVCSTCVTNPLDTLRVRLAASREATGLSQKRISCHIRELFHNGVVKGFTIGLTANLFASTPSNAIYLSTYNFLNQFTKQNEMNMHAAPVFSAVGAVLATNITLSPLFVLRTRVQVDPSKTIFQYCADILRVDGARGFYRGSFTNVVGRLVEETTFWYIYESLKRITEEGHFKDRHFAWASLMVLSLSSISKLIGSTLAYPYNVVMVHLREVNKITGKHDHVKVVPTIGHIYKHDGVKGFYKGISPHIARSMLSKATQILAFEVSMNMYRQLLSKKKGNIEI